jgi:Na+-translocating membrane potential-generating system (MpsC)
MSFTNREALHVGRDGLIAAVPPGAQATLNAQPPTVGGGAVRNDLSTALVKLYREIFGRGPVETTTHAFDAGYVTLLRDILAAHEHALVLGGRRISSGRRRVTSAKRSASDR